jgi:hypothetical protein
MGLNDIKLSPYLAAALYGHSLVEAPATDQTPSSSGKKTITASTGGEIINEHIIITVEEDDPTEPLPPSSTRKKTEKVSRSLGGNSKNILIVINYNNVVYLPDEELEFLTSMLKACKLNLDNVAIVNTNNSPGDGYKEYAKQYSSKVVLLFGVDPVSFDLPVSFPEFQVQSFNSNTFLYSPTLQECRTDKLLKSKLWVCLQRIFGL